MTIPVLITGGVIEMRIISNTEDNESIRKLSDELAYTLVLLC